MNKTAKQIKPTVSVIPVIPADVEKFWPLAEFMVSEALSYSGDYADSSDIYDLLMKSEAQLFIMFGSDETTQNKVFGICVTRIAPMPNYKQLEIIICTGQRRELWEDKIVSTITNFAKINDCHRLCIWARPGWEKISKKWGWKKKHVQLVKDL
jgi:esterase/lipase superfamily enzyme